MAAYWRRNPEAYAKHKARVIAYNARTPKRQEWVRCWKQRIGWYNPDLKELRRALKRVERALAHTAGRKSLRGTGE